MGLRTSDFDVFLSYSAEDRTFVRRLAHALTGLGLRVWFDDWIRTPGTPWQPGLAEGVESSVATAICVGANGMGEWQKIEMEAALARQAQSGHRVIPVLLPGAAENSIPTFLRRNTWVVLSPNIEERNALERLCWGITGTRPAAADELTEKQEPPRDRAIEDAIGHLQDTLRADNVSYFLGGGASHGGLMYPPSACEITKGLLLDLKLIDSTYNQLLPPVDVVSSYYAMRSGVTRLERRIVDMIVSRSENVPDTHNQLARLIALLANRPKPRVRARIRQLIVTTNLDVMIERALMREGISFVRLVQHTSSARIEVNRYENVTIAGGRTVHVGLGADARSARLDDWEALDELISTCGKASKPHGGDGPGRARGRTLPEEAGVDELTGSSADAPILYKFRGSQDVRGSCALSADQYYDYTRRLLRQPSIPAQITEILNSSPLLLMGFGFFDPDFRLIYHGLLRSALELRQDPVYSLQLSPEKEQEDAYRRMELQLWDKVKEAALRDLGISTLEVSGEDFLRLLIGAMTPSKVA